MKEKLKKVEDLRLDYSYDGCGGMDEDKCESGEFVRFTELKEEAIKWYKWFIRNSNTINIYEHETKPTRMCLAAALKEDRGKIIQEAKDDASRLSKTRSEIAGWIKQFFNISEGDLK